MIYLDNNATTMMSAEAKKAMIDWCNRGNPSSSYASAKEARAMMLSFRKFIGGLCYFDPCCPEDRDVSELEQKINAARRSDPGEYKILFTSGASEANCTAISGLVDSYAKVRKVIPHIVMSAIEHKSLYDLATVYQERGKAIVTFIKPTISGHIRPEDVKKAITPTTCVVCVMHANNETGAINDIAKIGLIAHNHNVPFHCDTVQTFGKSPIDPCASNVDSFCISFHKLGGPPGVGALVIKQKLLIGWKLTPMIFGTQNEGLRGGTENLPGIGAAFMATKLTMINRHQKNTTTSQLKNHIMNELAKYYPTIQYTKYMEASNLPPIVIVFISGATEFYLSNTILLSVVKKTQPNMCNTQLKDDLEKRNIVVSVGSACNTASPKASHVLFAMNADENIRKGAIRISLGDDNTIADADVFVRAFVEVIRLQLQL